MNFFELQQTGIEIQEILNSYRHLFQNVNELEQKIINAPLVKIDNVMSYNLDDIANNAIYYIPTYAIKRGTLIKPSFLEIYSDYVYVIHLQGSLGGVVYKSQYLITQDKKMKIICYQRNTNSNGEFGQFSNSIDPNREALDMLKITCWDE